MESLDVFVRQIGIPDHAGDLRRYLLGILPFVVAIEHGNVVEQRCTDLFPRALLRRLHQVVDRGQHAVGGLEGHLIEVLHRGPVLRNNPVQVILKILRQAILLQKQIPCGQQVTVPGSGIDLLLEIGNSIVIHPDRVVVSIS